MRVLRIRNLTFCVHLTYSCDHLANWWSFESLDNSVFIAAFIGACQALWLLSQILLFLSPCQSFNFINFSLFQLQNFNYLLICTSIPLHFSTSLQYYTNYRWFHIQLLMLHKLVFIFTMPKHFFTEILLFWSFSFYSLK